MVDIILYTGQYSASTLKGETRGSLLSTIDRTVTGAGARELANRLAAPLTFGIQAVAPLLAEFMAQHPGIKVDLRLSDAFVDIVGDGIDIALRIADLPDSSLRARRLGSVPTHIVASPGYFDRPGRPRHPADLASHACFIYTNMANPDVWRFRKAG